LRFDRLGKFSSGQAARFKGKTQTQFIEIFAKLEMNKTLYSCSYTTGGVSFGCYKPLQFSFSVQIFEKNVFSKKIDF
jgi:hypothetical protein